MRATHKIVKDQRAEMRVKGDKESLRFKKGGLVSLLSRTTANGRKEISQSSPEDRLLSKKLFRTVPTNCKGAKNSFSDRKTSSGSIRKRTPPRESATGPPQCQHHPPRDPTRLRGFLNSSEITIVQGQGATAMSYKIGTVPESKVRQ